MERKAMVNSEAPTRLEGKYSAKLVCWLLGNGCLFSWNSMLTIEDYYINLFPKYHPSRVLTLVYQPFAVGTIAILAYNEAKINTRARNLFGYSVFFFISTLVVLILNLATSKGGIGTFIGICAMSGAFGVADAHVQGGMVGDLSYMNPEFIQSFLAGLAASGALTSGLRLITKVAFENSKDGLRKGARSAAGGTVAKDALGNDVLVEQWLKAHGPGDRTLTQGLKGDPTYLVVEKDRTLATYGINAVCTHLGCVVPWNAAENKFICPCHGSQYNDQGRVVRGPAPLSLALAHCDVDSGKVVFVPWVETDFRTGDAPWWA